jgi:hypothetical protein
MDNSERYTAAADYRTADLQRASDFQAALLGMAGHDLRQPLQVIQRAYEVLRTAGVEKSQQAWLDHGEQAISRLTEQLDRLLGAFRLYEYTKAMELSSVALEPCLRGAYAQVDASPQRRMLVLLEDLMEQRTSYSRTCARRPGARSRERFLCGRASRDTAASTTWRDAVVITARRTPIVGSALKKRHRPRGSGRRSRVVVRRGWNCCGRSVHDCLVPFRSSPARWAPRIALQRLESAIALATRGARAQGASDV